MKSIFRTLTLVSLSWAVLSTWGCQRESTNTNVAENAEVVTPHSVEGEVIPGQYILLFREDKIASAISQLPASAATSREEKGQRMNALGEKVKTQIKDFLRAQKIDEQQVIAYYTAAMAGVAIRLDESQMNQLSRSGWLQSLEYDRIVPMPEVRVENVESGQSQRAQTTTCAITNAGGSAAAPTATWIWVVDSGIDLDHPDLNVNTQYAANFASGSSADDCNGHGTHVAGIAGAINNTIGVVGVSAGATVVPVRVFACSGGSATSTIINGVNHVATYCLAGDVCNMSLGGFFGANCANNSSYLASVNAVAATGTRVAIAAGNNAANAAQYQPACINGTNIFTVAAMACNRTFASSYSNRGRPPVDWIATGSSVYSTYLNGGYATLTGTSMATPVVAGVMHWRNAAPASGGNVTFSGVTYPIAVR